MEGDTGEERTLAEWPWRPWALAVLLGLAGLLIHLLTDHAQDSGIRMALAALTGVSSLALAFTLEPDRRRAPAIFAAITGLVMGGLVWRAVGQADDLAAEEYGIMAGVLAVGLALPLFQAGFHRRRWRTSYSDTHYHVWTDAISAGGALAFVGLAWIVLFLVGALLDLVGIPLDELIRQDWFGWTYSGAAFGAALGVLRNQLKIIGTLQAVVLTVFSLLAVPVALAVVVFLGAVLVSGPGVLWNATDSATPILLAIAAGNFVLVNAVIRDNAAAMSGNPALKIAARILALGILPLTVFAAISMGVRIDQHGLSPERLWGLAAILVAVAYGVGYFVDVVRGRKGRWPDRLRDSNLKLAVGTAVYALVLALPILNFGAISTAHQMARLHSVAVPVERFDFDALRWDFGTSGSKALAELADSDRADVALAAKQALARTSRPYRSYEGPDNGGVVAAERVANLAIQGGSEDLQDAIRSYVADSGIMCHRACRAIVVGPRAQDTHVILTDGRRIEHVAFDEDGVALPYSIRNGKLARGNRSDRGRERVQASEAGSDLLDVRPYRGRQLYIDGEPVGDPFE